MPKQPLVKISLIRRKVKGGHWTLLELGIGVWQSPQSYFSMKIHYKKINNTSESVFDNPIITDPLTKRFYASVSGYWHTNPGFLSHFLFGLGQGACQLCLVYNFRILLESIITCYQLSVIYCSSSGVYYYPPSFNSSFTLFQTNGQAGLFIPREGHDLVTSSRAQ